jgi:predicted outer membrane protein
MMKAQQGSRRMSAWLGAALVPLAAACAPAMGGSTALMTASGQADVAAHSFTSAVDAGEIQQAQLAQTRAQNQAVRTFAQRMITEHSSALQLREARMAQMGLGLRASTSALAQMNGNGGSMAMGGNGSGSGSSGSMGSGSTSGSGSMGSGSTGGSGSMGNGSEGMGMGSGAFTSSMVMSPSGMSDLNAVLMANPFSRPVAQGAMTDLQALQQLNGAAFDRMYITRQVEMHQYALTNIDRMLAQNTLSPDVRAIMTTQRAAVAMHLQMAQQLRSQL